MRYSQNNVRIVKNRNPPPPPDLATAPIDANLKLRTPPRHLWTNADKIPPTSPDRRMQTAEDNAIDSTDKDGALWTA